MPVKIYKTDASPPVRAVLMTAKLINLTYEPQEVNIMAGDTMTPEYLEKNPLHTIPLLEDGDFFLADSHAIMTYLVSKYGADKQAKLYPSELNLRATIDQRLFFEASVIFPLIGRMIKDLMKLSAPGLTPEQIQDANAVYGILEKYLHKTKFVACDHLTLADVSCVSTISSMHVMVPVDTKYEKLNAWWKVLQGEDWYKKGNVPGMTQLAAFFTSNMEKKQWQGIVFIRP